MHPEEKLEKSLSKFPQVNLFNGPSPVQDLINLRSKWNLGFDLSIKRDDLFGLAFGGNKSRQLEFLLGDAMALGSDCIVHGGAVQSNYGRQVAAACAMFDLDCYLVLSDYYKQQQNTGSHLVTQILGAKISYFHEELGHSHEIEKQRLSHHLETLGRKPYLITYPKSEILGSLGYLKATLELSRQLPADKFPQRIVMPAVGATYIGVLLGLKILGYTDVEVIGVAPLLDEYPIERTVLDSMKAICKLLEIDFESIDAPKINLNFSFVGAGYSKTTKESLGALVDFARYESVVLDPVYTSKAAASVKSLPSDGKRTLFWHTGGSPAIYAYADEILQHLNS
jgi:1-aminocyclopropane-1-carboxylate deaminase/D-cysteine desulfhydrase-like pyridoxal-dependent ACC family enzyme